MNLKGEQKWHTEGIVTTKAEELQEFRRAFLGWTPQEPEHGSFPSSHSSGSVVLGGRDTAQHHQNRPCHQISENHRKSSLSKN